MERRRMRVFVTIVTLSALIGPVAISSNATGFRAIGVESALGGFDFGAEPLKSDASLKSKLGSGCFSKREGPARVYWFPYAQTKAEFKLGKDKRIVAMKFSRERTHLKRCASQRPPANFKTGKGIRLGDPASKVVEVYGEPTAKEWVSENEPRLFRYDSPGPRPGDDEAGDTKLLRLEIEFQRGYVSSILLALAD